MHEIRHRESHSPVQSNGGPPASRMQFTSLAEWVEESVNAIGKERTKRALEAYAGGGYVGDDVSVLLARLIDLSEEPEQIGNDSAGGTFEMLGKLDQILGHEE